MFSLVYDTCSVTNLLTSLFLEKLINILSLRILIFIVSAELRPEHAFKCASSACMSNCEQHTRMQVWYCRYICLKISKSQELTRLTSYASFIISPYLPIVERTPSLSRIILFGPELQSFMIYYHYNIVGPYLGLDSSLFIL